MDNFLEKWKDDKKYRAKIKLLLYGVFIVIVAIYASSLNRKTPVTPDIIDNDNSNSVVNDIITIPDTYNYVIDITINDKTYKYSGKKEVDSLTITKETEDNITDYIFKDDEYYLKEGESYVKTTKAEVYDVVNYNYINLETINSYLSKAEKVNDQYLVYLKDVILGNETDEYFVITLNDPYTNVDYTPLMKQFNSDIQKYKVSIKIEK